MLASGVPTSRTQKLIIAGLMALTLGLSVGLAHALTLVRQPVSPSVMSVNVGGMSFMLEGAWEERDVNRGRLLIDQRRPTRRLRIVDFDLDEPMDPDTFLARHSGSVFRTADDRMVLRLRLAWPKSEQGAAVAIRTAVLQVEHDDRPALEHHAMAALTHDNHRLWAIHLVDFFDSPENTATLRELEYNELLVQGLASRARLTGVPASRLAPATPSPHPPESTPQTPPTTDADADDSTRPDNP